MSPEQTAAASIFDLTGGMGSGKSTVSAEFAGKGAIILDADQIVRNLQKPGQPVLLGMVAILGEEILTAEGGLDRATAGKRMFADAERKQAVENLIHPLVWTAIRAGVTQAEPEDTVVLDVPLLFETQPTGLQTMGTIVVDTEVELAVNRLVQYRGFSEAEARQRIATQMPREERVARADYVIPNNGSVEDLLQATDAAWAWMTSSRQ